MRERRHRGGTYPFPKASQVALVVKNLPASAGDIRDAGLFPGSSRCPRGGDGNPLQYSYLENPMDRGAWWATVSRVARSWTWLKRFGTHTHTHRATWLENSGVGSKAMLVNSENQHHSFIPCNIGKREKSWGSEERAQGGTQSHALGWLMLDKNVRWSKRLWDDLGWSQNDIGSLGDTVLN